MKLKVKYFLGFLIMILPFIMPTTVSAEDGVANVATDTEFKAAIADKTKKVINLTADIDLSNAGVLNIDGRNIDLKGFTISAANFSLIFEGSNFSIKNGNFDSKNGSYALFIGDSAITDNVLIENINTKGGINVFNSTNVILKNVNVEVNLPNNAYYAIWCDENAHVTVESGNYTSNGVAVIGMAKSETDLNIKGGNFVTDGNPLVLTSIKDGVEQYNKPVISGGTFNAPIDDYCATGFKPVDNGDGTYGITSIQKEEVVTKPTTDNTNINKTTNAKVTVTYLPTKTAKAPILVQNQINYEPEEITEISDEDDTNISDKKISKKEIQTTDETSANLSWWWILLLLVGIAVVMTFIILLIKKHKEED